MKSTERASFREFNKSPFIKFPINENISTAAHKVSLIIQVQLGGVELPNEKDFNRRQFLTEKSMVFERIQRLVRCAVDCKAYDCDAVATQNALELSRSISAEYWEHLPSQLRQIPNIGAAAVRKMVTAGINSVEKLITTDSATIERAMSRNPPFGHKLLDMLKEFPLLTLKADITGRIIKAGQSPKVKVRALLGFSNNRTPFWQRRSISLTFMAGISNGNLVHFWRGNIKKLEKGFEVHFMAELLSSTDAITCFLACDEVVGTVKSVILTPNIPELAFPPPKPVERVTHKTTPIIEKEKDDDDNEDDGTDKDAEFEWDDIDDNDLLCAIKLAEESGSKANNRTFVDQFIDIDQYEIENNSKTPAESKTVTEQPEPVQMPNGKWMCNHICRDGQTTKNGKICKHKCCHEGIDKPSRLQKKAKPDANKKETDGKIGGSTSKDSTKFVEQKLKLKRPEDDHNNAGQVEIIDLSQTLPPLPYEEVAPRQYRKLHTLHSQVSKSEPVQTLRNAKPTASYSNGVHPYESFLQKENLQRVNTDDEESSISDDLPSPSKVIDWGHDADSYAYPGFMADLQEDDSSYLAYGKPVTDDYYDEVEQKSEVLASSFVNAVVDHDTYLEQETLSYDEQRRAKREFSDVATSPLQPPEKRRLIGDGQKEKSNIDTRMAITDSVDAVSPKQGTTRPEWWDEFDPQFVAMFEGIVDFVE
jgi:ATP-dependent DNA helicase HFM1/MER3